jgi:electron transfer flavoprotein alpha/beta subunit
VTEKLAPTQPMGQQAKAGGPVVVWLGSAAPVRSVRWLDGALAAAAQFGPATALAAGDVTWLDLVADRAARARVASAGVTTDLELDYLGWAQVAAAGARSLASSTILVDEGSRPERAAEVGAIAELLDASQLTRVVALSRDGAVVQATRISGRELMTVRVRGPAVFGVRIAGPAVDDYPTPVPSVAMKRLELADLGLDATVLGHRALPRRTSAPPRGTAERIAEYLAVHLAPRGGK